VRIKFIRPKNLSTPLDWPLVLLCAMAALSLLVTAFPDTTRVQVMQLYGGILAAWVCMQLARTRRHLIWWAGVLVLLSIGFAALAPVAVQWSQNKDFLIPARVYAYFPLMFSDGVHPNVMASLMLLGLPLPLSWLLYLLDEQTEDVWQRRLLIGLLAALGLMSAILLLTKSRGGYIAVACGILITLWLSGYRRLTLGMGLVIIAGAIWLLSNLGSPEALPEFAEGATDPSTMGFRLRVWQAALWALADFPFTGVGMGAFNEVSALLYPFYEMQNPGAHNLFLQVGVDLGYPGLIAYLAVCLITVGMGIRIIKSFKSKDRLLRVLTIGIFSGLLAFWIHGLVDNTMWNTRAAFMPWLFIGWIGAADRYCHQDQFKDGKTLKREA
jgi:putative inorganic carbon (HCO3(-)) transporter